MSARKRAFMLNHQEYTTKCFAFFGRFLPAQEQTEIRRVPLKSRQRRKKWRKCAKTVWGPIMVFQHKTALFRHFRWVASVMQKHVEKHNFMLKHHEYTSRCFRTCSSFFAFLDAFKRLFFRIRSVRKRLRRTAKRAPELQKRARRTLKNFKRLFFF